MAFDRDAAAHYEAWYATPPGRRADALEKNTLSGLLQSFGHLDSVLEIGCGTAHFTRWLREQGMAAVGLDVSADMLTKARAMASPPLLRADALRLPFADGSFDLVALVTTLEFLPRPGPALAEALRVARRGLLLGVLNRCSLLGLQRRLEGLFRRTVYEAAHFYSVGELQALLRAVADRREYIAWRTTLFPRWWPWPQARLPYGAFIGMALSDRAVSGA